MPHFTISNYIYYTIIFAIFQISKTIKRLHQELQGISVTKLFKSDRMKLNGEFPLIKQRRCLDK